jgi:hypothetical protein
MIYVIIKNYEEGLYHTPSQPEACCVCDTEKRARDKAASLARDCVAEMVILGMLKNCMEVSIVENNHGFELYRKRKVGKMHLCGFTVSKVDCFDPPELEVKVNVNSGQFGDAVQPGDAAFYEEGGSNV